MLDLLYSCSTCCDPTERLFPILQRFKRSKLIFLLLKDEHVYFLSFEQIKYFSVKFKLVLSLSYHLKLFWTVLVSLLDHPCIYACRIYMTLYTWSPKCASSVQCGHCDPRCDQTGGRVLTLSNPNLPRGTHSVATVGYHMPPYPTSTLTRVWCAAGLNRVTLLK